MNVLLALTGLVAFLQLSQACPMVYMPVCGTDGHTYANECFMKTHARLHNLTLAVASQGKCVPKTEDICGFPFETGPCRAAFPRWFYDVKTGKCSQFIYGGCDGNKNNFETLEECEKKCDSDKTAEYPCFRTLQKLLTEQALLVQGEPVLAHKDNHLPECDKEGYFTPKQCDKSTGECWCVNRLGKEMLNTRKKGQDVRCEVCSLPKVVGPCRAAIRRWFFNKASGKCENFIYGGCQGNENNFEREEKCQAMCLPQELHKEKAPTRCEKEFLEATHKPLLGKFTPRCNPDGSYHLTQCHTSTGFCWCSHPDGTKYPGTEVRARPDCDKYRSLPDVATLLAASPAQTKCQKELLEATQMPLFGRFKPRCDSDGSYSLLQCHISTGYCWCSKPDGTKYPGTEIRGKPDCDKFKITPEIKSLFAALPAPASEDICGLASETGPCKAAFQRWFYDVKTGKCSQFIYGGCDGNRNNFGTLEDCEKKCDSKKTAEYPCFRTLQKLLTEQSILIHGEPASVHKNNHLPQCDKEGYFTPKQCDKSTGECWCVNRLGKEMLHTRRKGQDVSCDVCSLPKVVGPCMAAFRRCFFNKASGKCEQFIYGGCQGNENNFQGKEQCQAMCLPHKLRFQKVPSKCQQEVLKASQNHLLGSFTPLCNPDGSYNLIQCHTSTGFCWCSHPDGTRYPGTEVRRTPNCKNYKSLPQVTSLLVTEADVCSLPKVVGPCYAAIPRWFFDKASGKCEQFLYGGCQGNANNFAIKEECQSKCLPKKPSVLKDKSPIVASKQEEVVEASYQEKQATDTKYTSPRTSGNLPTVLAVSVCAALCILGVVVVLVVRKRRGNVAYNKLLNSTFEPIAGEKQSLINA